ncbi:O-antigen ligase family protein [bacterium]|nr:O-antigen ligase family protein [bacterium]
MNKRIVLYFYLFLFAFLSFASSQFSPQYLYALCLCYFTYRFREFKLPTGLGHRLFQIFLLYTLIQCFCSYTLSRSFFIFFKYLFLYFWFVDFQYFVEKRDQDRIRNVILFLSIPLIFLGIYQSFFVELSMPLSWFNHLLGPPKINRAFALFNNPNIFGSFLLILTLFSFQKSNRESKVGQALLVFTWIAALVLVCTLSRGAILSCLVALFFSFVLQKEKRKFSISLMVFICIAFYSSGRVNADQKGDLGANQRVELYRGVKNYLSQHWILGTSPGSFHMNYPSYRTLGGYYPLYAHNQLLEVWCEGGIFSFVLLLLVLYFALISIDTKSKILVLACVMNSMVNSSFSFFIILLLLLLFIEKKEIEPKIEVVPKLLLYLLFVLLSVFVAYQQFKIQLIQDKKIQSKNNLVRFIDQDYEFAIQFIGSRLKDDLSQDAIRSHISWLDSFTRKLPRESETFYLMGKLALKAKQDKIAFVFFKQSLRLDQFSEKNAIATLQIALKLKDHQLIQKIIDKVLYSNFQYRKINGLYDHLQYYYLISLLDQKKVNEAKIFYKECIWVDVKMKSHFKDIFQQEER